MKYLTNENNYPLLSRDEEVILFNKFKNNNDEEAFKKIVLSNIRFVLKISYQYSKFGLDINDLFQEGVIGLMKAARKFDPSKGFKFSTYAVWWIRSYLRNFVIKNWSISSTGTDIKQRRRFKNGEIKHHYSLNDICPLALSNSRREWQDNLVYEDCENQYKQVEKIEEQEILREKIKSISNGLNEIQSSILSERLLNDEPLTLQDIGDKFGRTRERVRQIENNLIEKIKNA